MDAAANLQARQRFDRLKTYLEADPRNSRLLEEAADAALLCGAGPEASALLEQALSFQPDAESLRFKLGSALLASGNALAAEAAFRRLRDAGNDHPAIVYNLAYAAFAAGKSTESLEHLDSIPLDRRAELPQYDLLGSRALYQAQDYEAALARIDGYLRAVPDDVEGIGLKALLLYDTNQNDAASELAKRLLAIHENDSMAHLVLGSLALERRQAAEAKAHFQKVVDRDPRAGRAWSGLAFSEMLETRLDLAQILFETAVEHMPNHLGTWHGLAWVRIMHRDFAGARDAVDAAMALDRTFSENHGTLAVLAVLEGRTAEAEAEVKRGMRLNPKSAASHFARSLLMAQAGDSGGSQRLVNKVLAGAGLENQSGIAEAILAMAGVRKQAPDSKPQSKQ